jgi:hypothetical protein
VVVVGGIAGVVHGVDIKGERRGTMKTSRKSGQAMIEFAAGLLVLLLLIIGFVHVSKLSLASLGLHGEIRAEAGLAAMQSSMTDTPEAISDWASGTDQVRFTADDEAQKNQPAAATVMGQVVSHSVQRESDWALLTEKSILPFSMIQLQKSPNLVILMGATHEERITRVPVDPFIRDLIYKKEDVAVKEEIWMPLTGGLY